jgi:hypothetical protein
MSTPSLADPVPADDVEQVSQMRWSEQQQQQR